jgi:hypothetical protein
MQPCKKDVPTLDHKTNKKQQTFPNQGMTCLVKNEWKWEDSVSKPQKYSAPTHLCVTVWGGFQMLAPRKTRIFLGWPSDSCLEWSHLSPLNPNKTAKTCIKISEIDEKDEDEIMMSQACWLISSRLEEDELI